MGWDGRDSGCIVQCWGHRVFYLACVRPVAAGVLQCSDEGHAW